MNTEKELIGKIRGLRQIRPRKDWVVLTKSRILGEEPKVLFFPFFKPALATITTLGILFGVFSLAQNSLPGDILYPIKKIAEKSQAVFVSEEELPKYNLEIANKRLEELTKIAETNQVKKLAPAIEEYQASVVKAAENLAKIKEPEKALDAGKKIVELKMFEGEIKSLGVVLPSEESEKLDNAISQLVEREIKELESQSLTEEQQTLLGEVKEDFEVGNYTQALEKILFLSY
jgi:hypothetical protein